MPTLSSLLIQRQVASMRVVEDAIARQVLHGGDLATNLLEAGVDEAALGRVLADHHGLEAAPPGRLAPEPDALAALPPDVARRLGVFPLARRQGTLALAVGEPLPPAAREELEALLGRAPRELVAPAARVLQALAEHFGLELERRVGRLVARLDGPPGLGGLSMPPPRGFVGLPRPSSLPPPGLRARPDPAVPRQPGLPRIEGLESLPRASSAPPPPEPAIPAAFSTRPSPPDRTPSSRARALGPALSSAPPSSIADPARALAALARPERSRRKGPLTAAEAERELLDAGTRDEVLDVFFAFSRQFFSYAALFAVQGELAEGRDAYGPGAERAKVRGLGVPLDLPSVLATARGRRAPVVAPLERGGLDGELLRDLGREAALDLDEVAAIPEVAVVPVVVRSRTVALLYGDDLPDAVSLSSIGEVIAHAALAARALERVIVRRKLGQAPAAAPEARAARRPSREPLAPRGPGVLARALSANASDASAGAPPLLARSAPPAPREDLEVGAGSPGEPEIGRISPGARSVPPPALFSELGTDAAPAFADGVSAVASSTRTPAPPLGPEAEEPAPARPRSLGEALAEAATRAGREGPSFPIPRSFEVSPPGVPSVPPRGPRRSLPPIPREEAEASGSARHLEARPVSRSPASLPPPAPGAEWSKLVDEVAAAGREADAAFAELVRSADLALPAIMARFPGPLLVDRHRARDDLPSAPRCGPLLELVVAIRRPALPFVTVRSASSDVESRFWATHVLGDLRYPEAASALFPRLFDDDVSVRRVARRSAASIVAAGSAGQPIVAGLDHMTRSPEEPASRRLLAIETMGEIRVGALVPSLLAVLGDGRPEVREAARRALLLVTRQDFGQEVARWSAWWQTKGERHRIEWLIDALVHELPSLRRAAADELKQLTKEYFGYYDDLPPRERERAQARYREWWEREGRFRFE